MKQNLLIIAVIAIVFSSCGTLKKTKKTSSQILAPSELPVAEWMKSIGSKAKIQINSDVLYVASGRTLSAIDLKTEQVLWKYKADNGKIIDKYVRKNLIVIHYEYAIHVIDITTGKLKWKKEGEIHPRAKLSFINNTLFYWKAHKSYLTKEALCSVDINTGNENWKIKSRQGSQFNIISDSTIAIEDSYSDWISETEEADFGIITVYNSKTGKMLWKMDLLNTRIKNSPDYSVIAISNNKIITKRNDTLFTFNGNTGKQIWSKKMDALSFKSNGNNLYASNNDNVVCIDFDGNQKWVFNFDKQEKKAKRIYQLVENNMIYIENGSTYLLNSVTGDLLWKKDTILSATNRSTYKKYPIILASNLTLIQTDKNTIKAYDNVDGAEKWIYKRNNSIYLDKNIYNGTLFISSGQGLLMACNNSDKAKSKIQTTAQGIDLYQYETIQFSSVNLPTNGKWMINTADKATAGAREFVVSEGSYGNIIRSLNWGSWKANIEDTDAAILAVKASTGDLIRYNDYHFRSTGEDVKIPVPVFTTKLVTLENGTKAVLVEAEIKITKPVTSRIFGNSYYARLYYFITDGEGEKTKFPVIASSAMFKAENYEKEKKEFQELIDYIANTAVLK